MELQEFEGKPVLGSAIKIRKAGDGLSEAMRLEPVELHKDDTVYVVLECKVGRIGFDPVKDIDAWTRVQDLVAGTATIMDSAVVKDAIAAQATKNEEAREADRIAKEEARGTKRIDSFIDLANDHDKGLHDTPAPGCPNCVATDAEGQPLEAALSPIEVEVPKPAPLAGRSRRRSAAGSKEPKATTKDPQ